MSIEQGIHNSSDLGLDDKNSWSTPQPVFDWLNDQFNFDLDVCASEENHKTKYYLSKDQTALEEDWFGWGDRGFCNPPYSRGMIKQFIDKAVEEATKGFETVFLVPNTTEASWCKMDQADEVIFIVGGRLSFVHPTTGKPQAGNTKGSMIMVFNRRGLSNQTRYSTIERDLIMSKACE
jgi:phage N-6-adenine-methyltransferase